VSPHRSACEAAFARRRRAEGCHVTDVCEHFVSDLRIDEPLGVCPACVEVGASWFHLRQCLACGRMGCCDRSPNQHATAHFLATGHPMIRTTEPDEDWRWCYACDRLYLPDAPDAPDPA
jgi:monovalent cation/hydrogen antiporter